MSSHKHVDTYTSLKHDHILTHMYILGLMQFLDFVKSKYMCTYSHMGKFLAWFHMYTDMHILMGSSSKLSHILAYVCI